MNSLLTSAVLSTVVLAGTIGFPSSVFGQVQNNTMTTGNLTSSNLMTGNLTSSNMTASNLTSSNATTGTTQALISPQLSLIGRSPQIMLNTISAYATKDGRISSITNNTEKVTSLTGLQALLAKGTSGKPDFGMNTLGIIHNSVTGNIVITHGLKSSNDGLVSEVANAARQAVGTNRVVFPYCFWIWGPNWSYHECGIIISS